MIPTDSILRPYFWNVPFWAQVGVYVLGFICIAIFIAGLVRAWKIVREDMPSGVSAPAKLSYSKTLLTVLMQRKVRETRSGLAHFSIFWGFVLLF